MRSTRTYRRSAARDRPGAASRRRRPPELSGRSPLHYERFGVYTDEEIEVELADEGVESAQLVPTSMAIGSTQLVVPAVDLSALPRPRVWMRYSREREEV